MHYNLQVDYSRPRNYVNVHYNLQAILRLNLSGESNLNRVFNCLFLEILWAVHLESCLVVDVYRTCSLLA